MSISLNTPSNIVTADLALWLDAANTASYSGSGSTWYDVSGNGHNCVFGSTPSYTSGSNGYFTFNGSSNYGTVTNTTLLNKFADAQTVIMWIRHTFTTGRKNPWNQAYGGYGTWTHEDGSYMNHYFGNAGGDGSPYEGYASATTPTSQWNCVVSTRGQSGQSLYMNNVLSWSNPNRWGRLAATSANITIGNGYAGYWQGDMAVVMAYTRQLSQEELSQNYYYYAARFGVTPKQGVTYTDNRTATSTTNFNRGSLITVATFTSTGTFVVPSNCTKVFIQCQGGGGGSAGYCESGGAGGYAEGIYPVVPGTSYAVTIGGGGGGVGYYAAATNGGTSSFGSLISASGGYGANRNHSHSGGHGGIGSGGQVNIYQGSGTSHANAGSHSQDGLGGGSYFGGAGSKTRGNNSDNYSPGYGTGGSGGIGEIGSTGVAGISGIVTVYAYK